jgi:hypothetical protein
MPVLIDEDIFGIVLNVEGAENSAVEPATGGCRPSI